jgi:hypothetical protein
MLMFMGQMVKVIRILTPHWSQLTLESILILLDLVIIANQEIGRLFIGLPPSMIIELFLIQGLKMALYNSLLAKARNSDVGTLLFLTLRLDLKPKLLAHPILHGVDLPKNLL